MLIIHGTAAFRAKVSAPPAEDATSTTTLGGWYANLVRRRRPHVLLVNERTQLPVLMPLAPARTFTARFPDAAAEVMREVGVPADFVSQEHAAMQPVAIVPTADRSLVGVLNDMGRMLDRWDIDDDSDLVGLSLWLAARPSGRLQFASPAKEVLRIAGALKSPGRSPRRGAPSPGAHATPTFPSSVTTPEGRRVEVRHQPGLADDLMRELRPLLLADGIDLDDPDHLPDRAALQSALDRAIERRNMELFSPVGPRRAAAVAELVQFSAAVADGRLELAQNVLAGVEPESHREDVAEVSAVIGVALGLLDDWLTGRSGDAPRHLDVGARLPDEWRRSAKPTTEILALARRGRAYSSLGALTTNHGGVEVLTSAALAVALVAQAWARVAGESVGALLPRIIR